MLPIYNLSSPESSLEKSKLSPRESSQQTIVLAPILLADQSGLKGSLPVPRNYGQFMGTKCGN